MRTIELVKPNWDPDSDDEIDDFEDSNSPDENSDLSFVATNKEEVNLITSAIRYANIEGLTAPSVHTIPSMCFLPNGGGRQVIQSSIVVARLTSLGVA